MENTNLVTNGSENGSKSSQYKLRDQYALWSKRSMIRKTEIISDLHIALTI